MSFCIQLNHAAKSVKGFFIYWREKNSGGQIQVHSQAGTFDLVPLSDLIPGQFVVPSNLHLAPQANIAGYQVRYLVADMILSAALALA